MHFKHFALAASECEKTTTSSQMFSCAYGQNLHVCVSQEACCWWFTCSHQHLSTVFAPNPSATVDTHLGSVSRETFPTESCHLRCGADFNSKFPGQCNVRGPDHQSLARRLLQPEEVLKAWTVQISDSPAGYV